MVTNSFGNKSFMQPTRRLNIHSWGVQFFFFWGGGWAGFFSPLVLNMFSWSSHGVPQGPKLFLGTFPIAFHFYPHTVCPKFNSHVYKLKRQAIGEHNYFYFVTRGWKRCFYWGECPMFQKNWWWTNQYGSFQKKRKTQKARERTMN
jgi:hypothetical protein